MKRNVLANLFKIQERSRVISLPVLYISSSRTIQGLRWLIVIVLNRDGICYLSPEKRRHEMTVNNAKY